MTNLTFVKKNGEFYGEFTATGPFAIQVKGGGMTVRVGMALSGTTDYSEVELSAKRGDFYCNQFGGEVWPMNIAVICSKNPESAGYQIKA